MERAHGELGARLPDGLRGDDADRLTQFDRRARREVAAVTGDADAVLALAGEHRADAHPFDPGTLDFLRPDFVDLLAGPEELPLRVTRIGNVVAGKPANDPFAEFDHFIFAFVNRLHPDAIAGAAIIFTDDNVLRHVHQLARHVTGVGGLERGVGQAFARAVSRDEVFEHGEALAEVGQDRFLDDVAGGLGHQTAHAGELAHLGLIAARAGVHHEPDRVVFPFALVVVEGLQHDVRDLVGAMRPDIDDLVVAFSRCDDAFAILLFDLGNLLLRGFNFLRFLLRNDHVVDADGNARAGGFEEAELLQPVEGCDGFLLPAKLVAIPYQLAELPLDHDPVRETEFLRPDFTEDHPADRGLNHFLRRVAVNALPSQVRIGQQNPVVRFDGAVHLREHNLAFRSKEHQPAFGIA